MTAELDISVLITTHDRAAVLAETLEAMERVRRDSLVVEFVVIDNNSRDNTKEVVASFSTRLPVRYLHEARPGKNCALNHALNVGRLGAIVVFTDDDVTPHEDWLLAILAVTARFPDISVFGGRIDIAWPNVPIPAWAKSPRIQGFAFGAHDHPWGEGLYQGNVLPFGGNLWVRRGILDGKRRFDESVGPRPTNRIMGSETTFLRRLSDDGFGMVYAPDAIVEHRIGPEMLKASAVRRRAYRQGRGIAHWKGLASAEMFRRNPRLWYFTCLVSIVKLFLHCVWSLTARSPTDRVEASVHAIRRIAHRVESLRLARAVRRKT